MGISNNIKLLRERYDMTQKQLGEIAGVTDKAVSTWENGSYEPRISALQNIADHFGLKISNLVEKKGMVLVDSYEKENRKYSVPILGRIAAGAPMEAIEEILDYEEINKSMANQGDHFGLIIDGDSMEPRMRFGDTVIVRKQPDVDSGQIAIVMVQDRDATCKKILKHNDGISLVSTNTKYEPTFFTYKEVEELPVSILGKVVELRARF